MTLVNRNNLIRKRCICSLFAMITLFGGSQVSAAENSKAKSTPVQKATDKKDTFTAKSPTAEPVIENVTAVSAEQLVNKPQDFLNKNVKFSAKFANFSSLALDYKPAMRPSKTYLSFLVFRNGMQIPLSELKLAMMIPKEKDSETKLLTELKEGDTIEIVGKVFSTALDDPWVDVLKLKKLASAQDDKKAAANADKAASDKKSEKSNDEKAKTGETEGSKK